MINAPLGSDGPNPTGLRVDGLAGTADSAAPEPTSLLIWCGMATAVIAAANRRPRR